MILCLSTTRPPGRPQQHAPGGLARCPFRPSVDHFAPRNVRLQPLAPLNSKGTNANDSPDATPIEAEARGHLAAQIGGALPAHYEGRAERGRYGRIARFGTRAAIKLTAIVGSSHRR